MGLSTETTRPTASPFTHQVSTATEIGLERELMLRLLVTNSGRVPTPDEWIRIGLGTQSENKKIKIKLAELGAKYDRLDKKWEALPA